jgi:hypothetical protein
VQYIPNIVDGDPIGETSRSSSSLSDMPAGFGEVLFSRRKRASESKPHASIYPASCIAVIAKLFRLIIIVVGVERSSIAFFDRILKIQVLNFVLFERTPPKGAGGVIHIRMFLGRILVYSLNKVTNAEKMVFTVHIVVIRNLPGRKLQSRKIPKSEFNIDYHEKSPAEESATFSCNNVIRGLPWAPL